MATPQQNQSKKHDKFHFWSSPSKYALALTCWCNTLGNARVFPTLLQKYGNIQVLLPYAMVTIFLIVPLVFAEVAIGQYTNNGFVNMWRMAPLLRGLAWSTASITFFASHCSLFMTTHAGYYLLKSFETTLPWTKCDSTWATEACWEHGEALHYFPLNVTPQDSVDHFYRQLVLSENALSFSEVNLRLFIFLTATIIIIGLCLVERIKSIEKLLMFATMIPFILLTILTGAALLNDADLAGLSMFMRTDFQLLLDYRVWVDVASNAVTNVGIAMGGLVCISAHGNFRSNIYAFSILIPLCNLLVDVLFSLFVYSSVAFEASQQFTTFEALFRDDTSLLFVKIPEALLDWTSHQQLWTIVYFLYLYITGARHLLFLVFTLTSGFHETFHCVYYLRRFSIAVLCFMILFVMPLYISPVGSAIFKEMENFCGATFVTLIATIETAGIFYVADARRLLVDVHFMLNKKIDRLRYLFYTIPVVLCATSVANFREWAWTSRNYDTVWIFILQCVILGLMAIFFVSHLTAYMVTNWKKGYKWILSPSDNWGCADEERRRHRQSFKSEIADARYTYRQELYDRQL